MIKFLEQIYYHVPNFGQNFATTQEFVEALASTLFPPAPVVKVEEEGDDDNEVRRHGKGRPFDNINTHLH